MLEHLTRNELELYTALRSDQYGPRVRLEQERIPFSEVERAVEATWTS